MPYEVYLNKDRAYAENLLYSGNFLGNILKICLNLFANSIIFLVVSFFLVMSYPLLFSFSFAFFLLLCIVYFVVFRQRIANTDYEFLKESEKFIRSVKNIFLCFKEIKIYGKEQFFLKIFRTALNRKNRAQVNKIFYNDIVRPSLEFILITFIVFVSFVLLYFLITLMLMCCNH